MVRSTPTNSRAPIPQQERVGCASRRRKTACRLSVPAGTLLRDEHHDAAADPASPRSGTTCPARASCCCRWWSSSSSAPVWCCRSTSSTCTRSAASRSATSGCCSACRRWSGSSWSARAAPPSTGSARGGSWSARWCCWSSATCCSPSPRRRGRPRRRSTLSGVAFGVSWPASQSLIAAVVPAELRQRYFGVNFTLLNLGIGIGGIIGGVVRRRRPAGHLPGDLPRRRGELPARRCSCCSVPLRHVAGRPVHDEARRGRAGRLPRGAAPARGRVADAAQLRLVVRRLLPAERRHAGVRPRRRRGLDPGPRARVRRQHPGDRAAPAGGAAAHRGPPPHPGHRRDGRAVGGGVAAARRVRAGARHARRDHAGRGAAPRSSRSARRCCSRPSRRWSTTSRPTTCAGATTR